MAQNVAFNFLTYQVMVRNDNSHTVILGPLQSLMSADPVIHGYQHVIALFPGLADSFQIEAVSFRKAIGNVETIGNGKLVQTSYKYCRSADAVTVIVAIYEYLTAVLSDFSQKIANPAQ